MKGLYGQRNSQSVWQMGVPIIAQKIYSSVVAVLIAAKEASIAQNLEQSAMGLLVKGGGIHSPPHPKTDHGGRRI
jgi:hypothetical protein